ncbi:MAG: 5'-deoxynucleotidase [Hydrogeniiclostridium mannosilyticum]
MFHFFAKLSRMKYIDRWGLMHNTRKENLSEHSFESAVLAHALAVLRNERFGGGVSPERAALLALFHDATEIITGDMPTPVKYYNGALRKAYAEVEAVARDRLLALLPADLQPVYDPLLSEGRTGSPEDQALIPLVKAADKLSALIKCVEERRMGNTEFVPAEAAMRESLRQMALPEVACFLSEFLPSYSLSLDEQE